MVKVIKFFCIIGIAGLLALFISYTEIEPSQETEKKITEVEELEQLDEESMKVEENESKESISFRVISLYW